MSSWAFRRCETALTSITLERETSAAPLWETLGFTGDQSSGVRPQKIGDAQQACCIGPTGVKRQVLLALRAQAWDTVRRLSEMLRVTGQSL